MQPINYMFSKLLMIKYHLLNFFWAFLFFPLWGDLFHFIKCERKLFLGIAPWVAI